MQVSVFPFLKLAVHVQKLSICSLEVVEQGVGKNGYFIPFKKMGKLGAYGKLSPMQL